jgi:C4-dicarboxylate-specific signal transduction histidine kinase
MAEMLQTRGAERDRVIDELQHLNEVLEQRVTERTIELQQRTGNSRPISNLRASSSSGCFPTDIPPLPEAPMGKRRRCTFAIVISRPARWVATFSTSLPSRTDRPESSFAT